MQQTSQLERTLGNLFKFLDPHIVIYLITQLQNTTKEADTNFFKLSKIKALSKTAMYNVFKDELKDMQVSESLGS